MTAAPRLAPLPKEEWGDDERQALRAGFGDAAVDQFFGADGGRVPNVLGTLMRHPGLAGPFLAYNNVLLRAPVLGARRRELLILRVAWRTRSTYEWVQHVRLALGCDITADEIAAIARGADADGWTPLEADLLAATDQLIDRHRIDDETWDRLAAHLDERELVEVVFVVGTYTCLAMAFNSFGLELDPDLHDVPAPPLPEAKETKENDGFAARSPREPAPAAGDQETEENDGFAARSPREPEPAAGDQETK